MFTKNFAMFLLALFSKNPSSFKVKTINGNNVNIVSSTSEYNEVVPWQPTGSIGSSYHSRRVFEVGTGTTPPTIDDYQVESYVSDILGVYTVSVFLSNDDVASCEFNVTFTNSGSVSHTVTEYTWMLDTSTYSSGSADRNNGFVCYRGLFSEPITIEAGTSFNFNFVERIPLNITL